MLSFSTRWNSHRHTDGEIMLGEIRSLGFESVELGPNLNISLLPGIRRLHQRGRIKVSGLHNFCPMPIGAVANQFGRCDFSSLEAKDQERALQLTYQTIDYAKELEAEFVIVNLGGTAMEGYTEKLVTYVNRDELHSRNYVQQKLAGIRIRERVGRKYLQQAKAALDHVVNYAAQKQIKIGVAMRSHYESIPNEREMLELMQEYEKNPFIGYWHDFGNAQLKANLGLMNHRQWLEKMQPYVIGCHLHDLQWPDQTHCVPLSGMIEFDELMEVIPDRTPIVWEMSSDRRKADIKQAVPIWEQRFGIK